MNKFFTIAILAGTLCQCRANSTDEIIGLKDNVKSLYSDLESYGGIIISKPKSKLGNLKRYRLENINAAVDEAYADILNDVAAAKNEGKHADYCSERMEPELRGAKKQASARLAKCVDDELIPFKAVKDNIDLYIKNAKLLLSELDDIPLSCMSFSQIQRDLCVDQQLPAARAAVDYYKTMAKEFKSTGDSLSLAAPTSVTLCFEFPMGIFYSAVSGARISAKECIGN